MKIKPLEWTESVDTKTQQLRICANFVEIGSEYDLGFEITEKFGKYRLILQNYNMGSDYHPLGKYDNLDDAKEMAWAYAKLQIKDIVERFIE